MVKIKIPCMVERKLPKSTSTISNKHATIMHVLGDVLKVKGTKMYKVYDNLEIQATSAMYILATNDMEIQAIARTA